MDILDDIEFEKNLQQERKYNEAHEAVARRYRGEPIVFLDKFNSIQFGVIEKIVRTGTIRVSQVRKECTQDTDPRTPHLDVIKPVDFNWAVDMSITINYGVFLGSYDSEKKYTQLREIQALHPI